MWIPYPCFKERRKKPQKAQEAQKSLTYVPLVLFVVPFLFLLINQLQPELNLARRRGCSRDQSRGGAERRARKNDRIRYSKVRMVQGIKKFRSELHADPFRYRGVLQYGQIHFG